MTRPDDPIGHPFGDPRLLEEALTHASYGHERGVPDNERLEYLGDAVLQIAVSSRLFHALPDSNEGQLSRARARIVSTRTLAAVGTEIGLGDRLRLGRGEEASGGRTRPSNLAAAVEAVLGAIFVDGGFEAADAAVQRWFGPRIQALAAAAPSGQTPFKDPRSRLQEHAQSAHKRAPAYAVTATEGPAHAPTFTVEVRVDGEVVGVGTGRSKREAARSAAEEALVRLELEDP